MRLTSYQATYAKTTIPIVVVGWVQAGSSEIQGVSVVVAVRRPTPVEAAQATTIRGRAADVAGVEEIIRESTPFLRALRIGILTHLLIQIIE